MYKVVELLERRPTVELYRALGQDDGLPVILKVLRSEHPVRREIDRLKREYEVGIRLSSPAIVRPRALTTHHDRLALVMEDFGGEPLSRLLENGAPMSLRRFLKTAIPLSAALAEVHRQGVIHKDIKPANILVNYETDETKISDFGIASFARREPRALQAERLIEGTLPYISPEQTGRMNRVLDHRSDLYSLGVTFYEMLTGDLPFHARDAMEWIHCHIAKPSTPPRTINPAIPAVVSDLIQKLLAKSVEDRYQSAFGLKFDLERCLDRWASTAEVEPFALGERDISERLQIPQKLYGREREAGELRSAFDEVLASGAPRLVLVSGYSGIGKTALVHELDGTVVRERGFFLSGKFDQYQRGAPYSTLIEAFQQLMADLLALSEEQIEVWRRLIQSALGGGAKVMVDVIPKLGLILGAQPPVPDLPLCEAQNRFNMLFLRLVGVFARRDHPLVIFLDDLQWADPSSLKLIQHVVTSPDTRYLLVIGAYRDNEVDAADMLMTVVDQIRTAGTPVRDITLAPLSVAHLCALCEDTLRCRREDAEPMAALLAEKTAGNPFFAIQFLRMLHRERLIAFDPDTAAWRCDIERIREQGFTDNVCSLLVGKLRRLPADVQRALRLAACLGNAASARALALLCGLADDALHRLLGAALEEGVLLYQEDTYRFLHDRIQQAAYSLIPDAERAATHHRIGRILLDHTPPDDLEDKVFDIVNHWNLGASLLTRRDERLCGSELNLRAGTRAKSAAAYELASAYFHAGIALLDEDAWAERYQLAYALLFQCAECETMNSRFDEAQRLVDALLGRARTHIDKAAAYQIKIALHMLKSEIRSAVLAGVEALKLVGVDLPPDPTDEDVDAEYERLSQALGGRPIASLRDLPRMTDPEMRTATDVLAALVTPSLYMGVNIFHMVPCRMVNISLRHGNAESSAVGYVFLGMPLSSPRFQRYEEGYEFGKLAHALVEGHGAAAGKVNMVFGIVISPWTRHIKHSLDYIDAGYRASIESGDLAFACICCNTLLTALLLRGDPLEDVYAESERCMEFVRHAGYADGVAFIQINQLFIRAMRGRSDGFSTFTGAGIDEREFEESLSRGRVALAVCWYYIMKLKARFLAGDHQEAIASAMKARELLWVTAYDVQISEYYFYYALAVAAVYDDAPPGDQARYLAVLSEHEERYRTMAANGPDNFSALHTLLAAELARIERRDVDAMNLYERAILAAREGGFPQFEGIAHEVAASFYVSRGLQTVTVAYLREAHACYGRWGAVGKVRQLERRFPDLVERAPLMPTTIAVRDEELNLISVLKASQSISGEILLPRLHSTLMRIAVEHAGAQKGYLISPRGNALVVMARASVETGEIRVEVPAVAELLSPALLPISVVKYTARSHESVILEDAAAAGAFASDEYIARNKPRSVMCIPILRQAEIASILYLENNLVGGAFAKDSLMVIELLAGQAAVSLENATLYSALEESRGRLQSIIDNTTAIVFVKDLELRYTLINRKFEEVFHVRLAEIVGKTDYDFLPESVADPLREHDERVLSTGAPQEVEETVPHDDGPHTYLVVKFPLREATGRPCAVCGICADITERKKVEQARAQLLQQEQDARDAAERAVRLRDDFLSIASHELYTPVAGLKLALQSLLRDASRTPTGPPKLLQLAEQQSRRVTKLIGDLMNVTRIQADKLELARESFDLVTLCRQVVDSMLHELEHARCVVLWRAPEPAVGVWDRGQMDQVVTNLLSNAIKYGAGTPIEICVAVADGAVRLTVSDRGIGIAPDRIARIFDRFERAASARHYGGLGLGLYIVREIVRAHGGTLDVLSELGRGSTFIVDLPRSLRCDDRVESAASGGTIRSEE